MIVCMRVVLNWPAGDNRDFKLEDEGDCEGYIYLDVFWRILKKSIPHPQKASFYFLSPEKLARLF